MVAQKVYSPEHKRMDTITSTWLTSAQNWKKNYVWEKNNLAQTFKWCDGMNQNLTIRNQRDEQKDSERTWEDTRHCAKVKFNLNLNFLKKREW